MIAAYGGPKDPGTASIKLMHYQGDLEGQGPVWGYVKGGMGMISFAIADAAQEAGAAARGRRPGGRDHPRRGRHGSRTARSSAPARSSATPTPSARWTCSPRSRTTTGTRLEALEDPQPRREVQRRADRAARVDRGARRALARAGDDRPHRRPRGRAARVRALRPRRARRRLRRDLHPDRLRPDARPAGPPPAERLRPVRALRAITDWDDPPRRGRASSSST